MGRTVPHIAVEAIRASVSLSDGGEAASLSDGGEAASSQDDVLELLTLMAQLVSIGGLSPSEKTSSFVPMKFEHHHHKKAPIQLKSPYCAHAVRLDKRFVNACLYVDVF